MKPQHPVWAEKTSKDVGMDHRIAEHMQDLYPRYPLRAPDEQHVCLEDYDVPPEGFHARPIDREYNQKTLQDDNQEVLHANHPFTPKGRT